MPKTPRLHLAAIGIVATLLTGCAVVDPAYYDDGTPAYRERHSDPYYGSSPGYYDHRPSHREYYPPRNNWRDRDDRDDRHRARPDHRDDRDARDARDRHPPKPQPPAPIQPQLRVLPKPKLYEDPPKEPPPRHKSDRYNPKTGQHDDMP